MSTKAKHYCFDRNTIFVSFHYQPHQIIIYFQTINYIFLGGGELPFWAKAPITLQHFILYDDILDEYLLSQYD